MEFELNEAEMDDLNSINKLYNDFIFVHKFFGVPFGETILSQEYINIYIIRFLKDQFRYKLVVKMIANNANID